MTSNLYPWQGYDAQGRQIAGQGLSKDTTHAQALLHASAHVWLWRETPHGPEILLQKRGAAKKVCPGCYDISAAGHIDEGEDPLVTAVRETQEELGITIPEASFHSLGVWRAYIVAPDKSWTENQFCWLYAAKVAADTRFSPNKGEVESIIWRTIPDVRQELANPTTRPTYTLHDDLYFETVLQAIEREATIFKNQT